jgi:uncharacterized protein YndB with AHSA1/START domain
MRGDKPGGPIRWRLHVPVPSERVFSALDSDNGRASFWAESAVERNGHIDFRFIDGSSYLGKILERRPPVVFAVDYLGGPVRFELSSDGTGSTDLLVTQEGVGAVEWNEVHAGWLNVLFPLKAWLMHGVDLRNHDSTRAWKQGYADQ